MSGRRFAVHKAFSTLPSGVSPAGLVLDTVDLEVPLVVNDHTLPAA